MQTISDHTQRTIVGFFSEAWDAEGALEDLNFAGFEARVRYIENDNASLSDSSKDLGGRLRDKTGFFARLYGFDDEDEYLDSRGNWTVSPEAEEYFTHAFERKHHVILIQADEDAAKAIDILRQHHGKVEEQNFGFLLSTQADRRRAVEGNTFGQTNFHQTLGIEPPLQSSF